VGPVSQKVAARKKDRWPALKTQEKTAEIMVDRPPASSSIRPPYCVAPRHSFNNENDHFLKMTTFASLFIHELHG
jgi:hypothetical protein